MYNILIILIIVLLIIFIAWNLFINIKNKNKKRIVIDVIGLIAGTLALIFHYIGI